MKQLANELAPVLIKELKLEPPVKDWLSTKEVSKLTSLSEPYIRALANQGEIKTSRLGRRILVSKESLDSFLKNKGR